MEMDMNVMQKAEVLIEALPYIQKFTGKTIVVRYDSGAVHGEAIEAVISDIILLSLVGIQVVMVTGDKKETAAAIARDAGLIQSQDDLALTSEDLAGLSDQALKDILPRLRVHWINHLIMAG